jgi:hypothetical protein
MVKEAYIRFLKIIQYKSVPQEHKHYFHQKKVIQRYITMHPRLEADYHQWSPSLFTYKNEKNIKIHNTINSIDGGVFSPMKSYLKYTMYLLKI